MIRMGTDGVRKTGRLNTLRGGNSPTLLTTKNTKEHETGAAWVIADAGSARIGVN